MAKGNAQTYKDKVTSVWFTHSPGLPPGPDRTKRLLKKPFPPRAAQETSGRCEQSALLFINHSRERSLLNTGITFEIPPVTSRPPKHGSWGLKYLFERKKRGVSICWNNWDQASCVLERTGVEAEAALLGGFSRGCFKLENLKTAPSSLISPIECWVLLCRKGK